MKRLEETYKFRLWKSRLEANGNTVRGVETLFSKYKADGSLLFALVNADVVSPEGQQLLPLCFMKGEVVCVLICLVNSETGKKNLLLVRQRRICDGSLTYEHPAGMLDAESDPAVVALREVQEETGIKIEPHQLIMLNPDRVFFPTTGTSDEAMYLAFAELTLTPAEIAALNGQARGAAGENEFITTHVVPFEEGYRLITNTNGLLHCFLYLSEAGDWDLMRRLKGAGSRS